MALLVAVGSGVISNSKARQTHATLRALDGLMKDYLVGNPEPQPPSPWNSAYPSPSPEYYETNTESDPINWVKLLRASDTKVRDRLAAFPTGKDPNGNITILDAWGTPIRYVPGDSATKKYGYFVSAGPDRIFSDTNTSKLMNPPPANKPFPPDDLYSTDPM
jgi:hypothetical protein